MFTIFIVCSSHNIFTTANRLQLNHEKTEALWCSSARRQHQIPTMPVRVGCTSVQPHICAACHCCYESRNVSRWRRLHAHSCDYNFSGMLCHATPDTKHSRFSATSSHADHAWSLVINKLDSCCSVMAGAPDVLLHRLQSVLNAAVRLVFSARKFDHTTPLLCELHWLKVPEC